MAELKLVDNGLVGTLPSALGGLEMLRYLHLGRNALSGGLSVIDIQCTYVKAPLLFCWAPFHVCPLGDFMMF